MEQLISKPLKRFLYTSKEFTKRRKDWNSLNVHFTAKPDEAEIKMSEVKSIIKTSPVKQLPKNSVLFNDSIETIANISTIESNDNSAKLVKVTMLEESVKKVPTILNLTKNEDASVQDNLEESAGDIQVENFSRQPSVIRIKVKVINMNKSDETSDEANVDTNKITEPNIETNVNITEPIIEITENISEPKTEIVESNIETSQNLTDPNIIDEITPKNISINKTEPIIEITENISEPKTKIVESNIETSKNLTDPNIIDEITPKNISVKVNELSNSICEAKSIEDFQNLPISNRHNIGETCIFDENKTRPLSPIPVLPLPNSPQNNKYTTIDNLIDYHERQVHKMSHRSPPKTLPRMGMSSLLNRSPSKLDDSEIISQMVRDRFVVNMYESRSFRRNIKKPSTYGRFYKTLERTVNVKNDRNDFITHNLLNNEIVNVKQSSPIKTLQNVIQTLNKSLNNSSIESKDRSIEKITDIKNVSITEEPELEEEIKSTETLCCKDDLQTVNNEDFQIQTLTYCKDFQTPSSEYGSGSNSIQSSVASLEKQLENVPEYPESQYEHTFGSDVSSYNMEEFLKKALGDELNNLDNTEIEPKLPLPKHLDASISTSNASDLISKINTFQSQLYRSFTRKLQHVAGTLRHPHSHCKLQDNVSSARSDLDSLFSNNEEVGALLKQAAVQYEALKQISKALTLCRNSKEFCVSSEQVEGERLLLIATHKRQSILSEIRRLEYSPSPSPTFPSPGSVTITNITIPLRPATPEQPRGRDLTKWYVAVFSSGLQVTATRPTLAADGCVRFKEEVVFHDLETEVEIDVEVYCLLQRRPGRNLSHESKYHINKDTKRSHCPTPKKFLSREKSSQKQPARYDTGIRTSSFKLCGSLKLTVSDLTKPGPWELRGKIPLCSSLIGSIALTLHSKVQIPIKHSGFLTIGSESGGCAAWNRRWCVLEGHVIKYWNYPSEEEAAALKELDLKYCVSSVVQTADRSLCARPRTLLLEIARKPKPNDSNSLMTACAGSYTIERYYLSADNLADLNIWQEQLDKVVQSLRIWNVGFLS